MNDERSETMTANTSTTPQRALAAAKDWRQDRIEVASLPED